MPQSLQTTGLLIAVLIFLIIFGIIVLYYLLKEQRVAVPTPSATGYGDAAEERMARLFENRYGTHRTMSDVFIKSGSKLAQIDHIVVTKKVVLVVETKSHRGLIVTDSGDDNVWIQKMPAKTVKFYNPVRQNNTHCRLVREILNRNGLRDVPLVGLVVFDAKDTHFTKLVHNVVRSDRLPILLDKLDAQKLPNIPVSSAVHIIGTLEQNCEDDRTAQRQYISQISE